ncbi:MAG: DUF4157 domain-containing protein [Acidobacteria bacterium]|nr:DUF4157 domain-containing protein [Acidobacteriota bacterium]
MCEVSESEEKLKKLKKESDPGEDEDDTVIQSKATDSPTSPETPVPVANNTGLPDTLKTGIESLSGISLDDVNVHYNSSQPAQLQALAYTQGTDIHVGPGQEQHLAHEAWHVVQQKQGRVQPTTQLQDVAINDDFGLEREADVMGGKALQAKAERGLKLHPSENQTVAASSVAQLFEMETADGTWDFSDYAIQNKGWRGLTEHTLTYRPKDGIGEDKIALIQVVQSNIDGEIIHLDKTSEARTSPETGFRIDNFTDSNNPIFGAASAKSLTETPIQDDTYQIGGKLNKGTSRRKQVVTQEPWRLDNPGLGIKDLNKQKALSLPMGQTFITAAYNLATGQYLGSIAYGWAQEQDGEPQLLEMTYTTGGVSGVFLSAVSQWNKGKTKGNQNLQLPVPEGVKVQSFQKEEDNIVEDLDEIEDNQMEMDDMEMGGQELSFEEWIQQLQHWFFQEYGANLSDYPDEPYQLEYEEGMSPQDFYDQYLANGKAF